MTQAKDHGFITEAEVIETWPMIPATDIRRARRKGDLPFYQFPAGPHYRRQDVEAFIERKYRRGPAHAHEAEHSLPPEPINPTVVRPNPIKPTPPVSPRPQGYETMAAEEARIQMEALAKRSPRATPVAETTVPSDPVPHETREEEINRLRVEAYEQRIANRPTRAQRKRTEAAAVGKGINVPRKGRRVSSKPDRS